MEGALYTTPEVPTEGVLTFDQSGRLRACDAGAVQLFGYSPAAMLGRPAGELLPDAFPLPPASLTGAPVRAALPAVHGRRQDGTLVLLAVTVSECYLEGERLFSAVVRPAALPDALRGPEASRPGRVATLIALERAFDQALPLQAVLDRIVDAASAGLPASAGAVLVLWDPERNATRVSAGSRPGGQGGGRPHWEQAPPRTGGPTRWLVENHQPLLMHNIRRDPFETAQLLAEYDFQAYAAIPVHADGVVFGALFALDRQPRTYTAADLDFLTALATRAALAIARVHLYRQLQRAQDAWHESEARFRTFVESLGEGLLICDLEYRVTYASPRMTQLSGYPPHELVGQRLYEMVEPPAEWPNRGALWGRRTTQRLPESANPDPVRLTRKDGARIWVDMHLSPMRNALGTVTGTLIVLTDVSERMQAEEALRESEDRYRSLFDQSLDAVVLGTPTGQVLAANAAATHIFGRSHDEIRLVGWNGLFDLADARLPGALAERARTGRFTGELGFKRQDGTMFPGEVSSVIFKDRGGGERTSMIIRDITERKQAEAALQEANAQLVHTVQELQGRTREVALLNEMGDMLQTCFTAGEAYDVIASFAARLFAGEAGALYLLNDAHSTLKIAASWGEPAALKRAFSPNDCWALRRGRPYGTGGRQGGPPCAHLEADQVGDALCVPMMAQGELIGVVCLRSMVADTLLSPEGAPSQQRMAVALGEHVALALANLKLRASLQSQAIRDPLTGLFNRRYMEESLEREIHRANRSGHPLGIIMVDVDHFKRFNDKYGHAAGDRLLAGLGQLLQTKIRGADLACRYGGEEFIVIMPETARDVVRRRAEELRSEARYLRIQYGTQTIGPVTLSLGVATYPEQGTTAETIVRAADEALYQAKTEGRDRVVLSARRKDLVPVAMSGGGRPPAQARG